MNSLHEQPQHHHYTLFGHLSQSTVSSSYYSDIHGVFQSPVLKEYAIREINALLWVLLIAVTVLLLAKVYELFRLWAKARVIPGPPCSSFYGHSKLISGSNLTDLLSKSHHLYGPVVKMWLGPTQLLVSIKDPELIKEMLLNAQDKLPSTGRAYRLAFGQASLFVSSFEKVQKRRDSLATELNGKLLEKANMIPAKVVDSVLKKLQENTAKGTLDCKLVSQHLAFTILGATLFGDAFLSWPKATVYEELLMMIAHEACFWASYRVTPFWKRGFWRYQCLCAKLKRLTQDIIEQGRQNYKYRCQVNKKSDNETINVGTNATPCPPYSSSDVTPDSLFVRELDSRLDEREPSGNIMSLMFHGCLTTASLVSNILARLAMHPEIQAKIHSEIIMVRKSSSKPYLQVVEKMPLLLASVYESARLLPAGPLLQRCSLKHDVTLKTGVMIPAGAMITVPVQLVQMDDSSWGDDANQFNPHRFLSTAKKRSDLFHVTSLAGESANAGRSSFVLNERNEDAAFLPFGSGTRACVGQKFAILAVATIIASLLENYEIGLQPGSEKYPKSMINNCVFQLLPSPKIVILKRTSS